MSKASAAIILFKSKTLKEGTHPVVLRITHERKRNYISLGKSCSPNEWNVVASRFNSKYTRYKEENKVLTAKQKEADDILTEIERGAGDFSFNAFELAFKKKAQRMTLASYFQEWITKFNKEDKIGNATAYSNSLSAIERYRPGLKLSDVTVMTLKHFETWLRADLKLKDTSISVYMRTLRTVINKAISEGLFRPEDYPFSRNRNDKHKYQISKLKTKTSKRAISKDSINDIIKLKPEDKKIVFAKQIFLFSYFTIGMNFIDIAFLKWSNVRSGRINYVRRKNGKVFSIKILPQAQEILNKFSSSKNKHSDYVFPILNDAIHQTAKQKHTRVKTVLRNVNSGLKEIATEIDQEGLNLTSYVSRHSVATHLKKGGLSTGIIRQAFKHDSEATTDIYLEEIEPEKIDDAIQAVL